MIKVITENLSVRDLDSELVPLYNLLTKEVVGEYYIKGDKQNQYEDEVYDLSLVILNKYTISIVVDGITTSSKFYIQYEGELRFEDYLLDIIETFKTTPTGIKQAVKFYKNLYKDEIKLD